MQFGSMVSKLCSNKNTYKQTKLNHLSCPSLSVTSFFCTICFRCRESLLKLGIDFNTSSHTPDVELTLPKLKGKDVVEHFYNIAEDQCASYRQLMRKLAECDLPPQPKVKSNKITLCILSFTTPYNPQACW